MAGGLQLVGGLVEGTVVGELPAGEGQPFSVVGVPHDHPVWPLVDPHVQLDRRRAGRDDHRAECLGVAAPRIQIRDVDADVTQRSHVHAAPPLVVSIVSSKGTSAELGDLPRPWTPAGRP